MFFQTRNLYHLRVNKHTVLPLYLYLDENHVDWMTRSILNEIVADLKPLIGPKLVKESHIGASGLSSSAMKKVGQSVVEVHRGDNYQFAYFLKPGESYDLLIKARDFVPVTTKEDPPILIEHTPTPEPPKTKRSKSTRKRAPKAKARPRVVSAAKKRKRAELYEEDDAEMSDAWSDLDKSTQGSEGENNSGVTITSSTTPARRSARRKNILPEQDIDENMDQDVRGGPSISQGPLPETVVKSEPDDTSSLANLLPISAHDESTPTPSFSSSKPPSEHIVVDEEEEEKPKQELHLTYAGHVIPSRCLCVIVEPWPALPTPGQLVAQTTRPRPKHSPSKPATILRPLFRADSDDEEERPARSPSPEFDSDDEEGRLRMFSQMINKVGERHSGVAVRGGMEEFEDDALYGDADEEGRGI